jgi:hypothetical protein
MGALALIPILVGCSADPCDKFAGQTCISLELTGTVSIDQILVTASGAFSLSDVPAPDQPRADAVDLPVALAVLPGNVSGDFTLSVRAEKGHADVATGAIGGTLQSGKVLSLVMPLLSVTADLANTPDLSQRFDLAGVDLAGVLCDVVTQAPCSGGQKCVNSGSASVCVADGTATVAQSCTTDPADSCARGTQCLFPGDFGPTNGICEQFCGKESDCTQAAVSVAGMSLPANRAHCIFQLNGAGPIDLCSVACNPVSSRGSSGCPSGSVCVYGSNASFPEFTFCDRAGTGTDGQSCNSSSRCAPGFNCLLNTNSMMICRAVCRAGNGSDCTAPNVCKPGAGGSPPMFGYCCPSTGC